MKTRSKIWLAFFVLWVVILGGAAAAYKAYEFFFSGPGVLKVPFILWGGDVATFHANGGLKTEKGRLFAKHGLQVELIRHPGDDFTKQVEDYKKGISPFLRGTMSMIAQAGKDIGEDENLKPVVFLQMTWSKGDHLVARSGLKTLADLKGKKIALQKRGPHVGMLQDILATARLEWDKDIQVVWTEAVTGKDGPGDKFSKDRSIDACFVITPDMEGLTGGLDKVGKDGAHVLISTAHMSRSIADVYACRKDFFDSNRETVEKFAAAYLKACEELIDMKGKDSPDYKALLKKTQDIYGKEDIQDEGAARGLIDDAGFVGFGGNRSFFTQEGNLSSFKWKMNAALDVARRLGDAPRGFAFLNAELDYTKLKKTGDLTDRPPAPERFAQNLKFLPENTIYSFPIYFGANQVDFPAAEFGRDFQRALEQASLFGNAAMILRGHTDAITLLDSYAKAGTAKGDLKPTGKKLIVPAKEPIEIYSKYELAGVGILDFQDPKTSRTIAERIRKNENFGDSQLNTAVDRLRNLSENRAKAARDAVLEFAKEREYRFDVSQIRPPIGVGMEEPAVPIPVLDSDRTANRRVEVRIVRVNLADVKVGDFDH